MSWKGLIHFLAYGLGAGLVPFAPGTVGSLLGVALFRAMASLRAVYYSAITLAMGVAGVFICGQTARDLVLRDPGSIVWDEIVGYLVAMFRLPSDWRWISGGFVLYRLFDIWKPYPIGLIEDGLEIGVAIMADDIVAGIYAGALLHLLHWRMRS